MEKNFFLGCIGGTKRKRRNGKTTARNGKKT